MPSRFKYDTVHFQVRRSKSLVDILAVKDLDNNINRAAATPLHSNNIILRYTQQFGVKQGQLGESSLPNVNVKNIFCGAVETAVIAAIL